MRLYRDEINAELATWLGCLSYDPTLNDFISLPSLISQVPEMSDLYEQVFPQAQMYTAHETLKLSPSQGILTPFNEVATEMNAELLS